MAIVHQVGVRFALQKLQLVCRGAPNFQEGAFVYEIIQRRSVSYEEQQNVIDFSVLWDARTQSAYMPVRRFPFYMVAGVGSSKKVAFLPYM